jgi:stachydrine N-demethylase, reductase component
MSGARSRFRHLDEMPPWDDRAQILECVAVLPEAPDVKTFRFRATDQGWFRYLPGQFVTLELPVGAETLLRTYTLSSSPSQPLSVAVTVKAQSGSIGSRWMLDRLKVGDRLKAHGPTGAFSFHHHPAEKYLFLSAGSGITPMMSMTRWLYDDGRPMDVTFINFARRPSEIIFRSELERLATEIARMTLAWVVEEPGPGEVWTGYRGRLSPTLLKLITPDHVAREVFCCGPEPFMRAARTILGEAGLDMARYHEESFQEPAANAAPPAAADQVSGPEAGRAGAACIVFARSGQETECLESETILDVARRSGLNIPSACRFGVCGTCKIRRLSGESQMTHNGGIRDDEATEGYVLACCTKPIGRIEVDA